MPVESATYVSQLVSANPSSTDPTNQGDDHLRLIKAALLASFPNVAGAVSATDTQLSLVGKLISALQNHEWTAIGAPGAFTITVPTWASRIEVQAVGGGGGGANCSATSSSQQYSGPGGGAGGYVHGVYSVAPGATLSGYVGAAGGSQQSGGATSLSSGGTALFTCNGGQGGAWATGGTVAGPGADGGTATGGNIVNERGGPGGDGQIGGTQLLGNGGSSYFGGGGRAASHGNVAVAGGNIPANSPSYGAGGGGAYDVNFSGTTYYGGGGGVGLLLYRFLL